ncbi:sugar phosphate isomerase/epimerase family protein [Aureimonas ureilytica]|uniref:sugar phosphate isomerase/epimerase family protein n=1 Tax=Aureimonas ureilytica TaxID=401562 RepID=UPI000AACA013|nr:sugar phosphate isomerase/epimerase [Aureimonas ureilytica]
MTTQAVPLGVAHFSAIALPPLDFVCAAAKAGFSRVGLRLHPAFPGAPFYELPAGSLAARDVRSALADHGLSLFDIEFVVLSPDFRPETLTGMLEGAAALGAKRLSVCGDDPDEARLTDTFAGLCDLCAGVGMSVDLENMGWRPVATFEAALRVVEASGRANAGVLVDAIHLFRNGGRADQVARAPAGRIAALQLCDVRGRPQRARREWWRKRARGDLRPEKGCSRLQTSSPPCQGRRPSPWRFRSQKAASPPITSRIWRGVPDMFWAVKACPDFKPCDPPGGQVSCRTSGRRRGPIIIHPGRIS